MSEHSVVVVGAGSAGCVVAARLSEDPSCQVLLLEAGPDYWPGDVFPELVEGRQGPTIVPAYDWRLTGCMGAGGRIVDIARGRVVGGSSAVNAAVAPRGSVHDYDRWAAAGNPGWSYADLLPALCRLEHDLDFGDADYHGSDGPIPVQREDDRAPSPWGEIVAAALTEVGLPRIDDHNAPGAVGVGRWPANTRYGQRISTSVGYLDPVRHRANLQVRSAAVVDRIGLRGGRATSVVLVDGEQIHADEVVLCAGAFLSPAILMRSGIGPAAELARHGIDVVVPLEGVGRNLADHPAVSIDLVYPMPAPTDSARFEWLGTLHSSRADPSAGPDLHILTGGPFPQDDGSLVCFMAAAVMKPRSRGHVELASADPNIGPVIDLGYFRDGIDVDVIIEGLDVIEAALATSTGVTRSPADRVTPRVRNDEAGRADVLTRSWTYYHPTSSCAMGPDPEAGAVVDARCRVYGVDALAVVDASVMPEIVGANTNVTTIAIAERYAELRRPDLPAARAPDEQPTPVQADR